MEVEGSFLRLTGIARKALGPLLVLKSKTQTEKPQERALALSLLVVCVSARTSEESLWVAAGQKEERWRGVVFMGKERRLVACAAWRVLLDGREITV